MLPECADLDAYRLEHDWTWEQLAEAMRRAKFPVPARTLHYMVKRAPLDYTPNDRTIYKIRKFIESARDAERRRAARRKATKAATSTAQAAR